MKARIRKWGNSLAVRIPKKMAAEADLSEGTSVELTFANKALSIKKRWTLSELLDGITEANMHDAWDTGMPCGKEWL